MIRRLSQMFLVGKRVTTSKLLRVLLDTVIPWVRVVRVQGLENLVHHIDRASKQQEKNETAAIEILQTPDAVTAADLGPDCWNVISMSQKGWYITKIMLPYSHLNISKGTLCIYHSTPT